MSMGVYICVCMSHSTIQTDLLIPFCRQREVQSVEDVVDLLALQLDLDPLGQETVTRLGQTQGDKMSFKSQNLSPDFVQQMLFVNDILLQNINSNYQFL